MKSVELVQEKLNYQMTEEINQLRANVQFSGIDKKVILITSATENEGKSSIALELGKSLAGIGKNVLLLDADMRKSILMQKTMDLSSDYIGLSHVLAGQEKRDNALYQTNMENFYVVFAGRVPPNPSELLSGPRMEELITWAREQFDYVIVDCPPLNAVIDAAVVAPHCDGAIVVIKADMVPYRMAQNVLRQLQATQCHIMGVVLNQVESKKQGYYYRRYYRKYGYGYRKYGYGHYGYGNYGSYGHSDDEKETKAQKRKAARQEKAAAKKEAAAAKKEAAAAKKADRRERPRKRAKAVPAPVSDEQFTDQFTDAE